MAKEIQTGVALTLKDNFSSAIKKAGGASADFASKTLGAIDKVDKVFSGMATKLGALGVTFSVGAATKELIDMDAAITAMGAQAGLADEKILEFKKDIFEVANAPKVKLDTTSLIEASATIVDLTGDANFAKENLETMGLALRATGSAGDAIGGIFTLFKNSNISGEALNNTLGTMVAMANKGAFTARDLAALGPRVFSAYLATGREASKAYADATAALEVIRVGVGSSEQAATAFEALIRNLSDPKKLEGLAAMGVEVNLASQSIGTIMKDIIEATDGDSKVLYGIFDAEAVRTFNSGMMEYQATLKDTGRGAVTSFAAMEKTLGGIADIEGLAAQNANTLKANIQNIQTAFLRFINSGIEGPLSGIADALNKLSENPENLQRAFKAVAIGIGSIAAIKGIAGISRLIGSISRLSGGKLSVTQSLEAATAMPVYVTNWGGMSGGLPVGAAPGTGANPALFNPAALKNGSWRGSAVSAVRNLKPGQLAAGGATAGIGAAFIAVPQMMQELDAIKANTELSDSERGKAKGGAIGDATGTIVGGVAGGIGGMALGTAAGAAIAGAAIGSIVPGLGTAIGALVGAGVGALGMWLGGKAGRAIGEGIGEGVTSKPTIPASKLPSSLANYAPYTMNQQAVNLNGQVGLGVNISVQDDRVKTSSYFNRASAPAWLNTGYAYSARSYN